MEDCQGNSKVVDVNDNDVDEVHGLTSENIAIGYASERTGVAQGTRESLIPLLQRIRFSFDVLDNGRLR